MNWLVKKRDGVGAVVLVGSLLSSGFLGVYAEMSSTPKATFISTDVLPDSVSGFTPPSTPNSATSPVNGVYVFADGAGRTVDPGKAKTVGDLLSLLNIKLQDKDTVSSPLNAPLTDQQIITVTRVSERRAQKTEPVNFSSSTNKTSVSCSGDNSSDVSNGVKTLTKGVKGERLIVNLETYVNGTKTSSKEVTNKVNRQPVNEVKANCSSDSASSANGTPSDNSTSSSSSGGNSDNSSSSSNSGGSGSSSSSSDSSSNSSSGGNSSGSSSSSGGSSSSSSSVPSVTVSGSHADWMKAAGISSSDYAFVDYIVYHESGWNYKAVNAGSGAFGLCQALPGGKMSSAGSDWQTNPVTQLKWCNGYAAQRYRWLGGGLQCMVNQALVVNSLL